MTLPNKLVTSSLAIAFLFTGCQSTPQTNEEAASGPESLPVSLQLSAEQIDLAGIELGKPEKRTLAGSFGCTGKVDVPPQSLASVYAPVSGFVQSVKHLPGEYVRKGELLTVLQHPDLIKTQREFLECRSRLAFLEKEFERKKILAETDATSKRAYEQATAELELEKARYKGLKAELQLIGIDTAKLEAGGDIQSTIALTSPINGYIATVMVNKGKLVSPNDLLYEIVDDTHIHLELEIFAKDIHKLREGQRVEARLPGTSQVFPAEVHLIGKIIDPATRTIKVHSHFEKEPLPLTPGTYMQARVFTRETPVWTVQETAIVRQGDAAYVFVQTETGFKKVPVTTGLAEDGYVELLEMADLENRKIVLKGAYYLNGLGEEE